MTSPTPNASPLDRWRQRLGGRRRRANPRPLAALGYLASGPVIDGLVEIDRLTTVKRLFDERIGSSHPENYLIRVNRQPVSADQVLQGDDRVSITPVKIEGA